MRCLTSLALLLALGCFAPASVPEAERQRVHRELRGLPRFTRVAAYLAPFPGDASKALLSDQPVEALGPGTAGVPERILPPGTLLQLEEVEFPAGWQAAARAPGTLRGHPWAYLRLAGEPRRLVVVLPRTLTTAEEVRESLERVVGPGDPGPSFAALPDEQRAAIQRKGLAEGMAARAVEMAWGLPERKVVTSSTSREEWSWPAAGRSALLEDGRLVGWSGR